MKNRKEVTPKPHDNLNSAEITGIFAKSFLDFV